MRVYNFYSCQFLKLVLQFIFFETFHQIAYSERSALEKDVKNPNLEKISKFLKIGLNNSIPDKNANTQSFDFKPDHLQGLKIERDGHINKEFRKEVLLGNTSDGNSSQHEILTVIFKKADTNGDNVLSEEELEKWIVAKVEEHFSQAVKDNFRIFSTLDKNHDGRVSWYEYHVNFMNEQGFDEKFSKDHPENHKGLERKVKEKILLDKAAWSEAANSDAEALNIDEFLTFRHPEHSHVSLMNMVNDIIISLDMDGDEELTEEEFASMSPDGSEMSEQEWRQERIREFKNNIDLSHNGKVTRQELLMYSDPENPVHAKKEARDLFHLADANKDKRLTLSEIFAKKDIFLGSKMVDTAKSFHDEF